ncbi:MAG: UDP-N-acetylmuramate dehydrogenase [Clostridia bacterium]|nr:UDP-N-acetylmuramate dehydrogenase [Clostridia bacterium]
MDQLAIWKQKGIEWQEDVPGATLSTFRSGGTVHYVVYPKDEIELETVVSSLKGMRYHLLGLGSNTLVSDHGLEVVVSTRHLAGAQVEGESIVAWAGEPMPKVAELAKANALTGAEWMTGIPGSIGGAVKMNAGAYGHGMADIVDKVLVLEDGALRWLTAKDLKFGYRTSALRGIAVKVVMRLKSGDRAAIESTMEQIRLIRARTQPHEPSLGSVFKAYQGRPAAPYIQAAGMKGVKIGQAKVSGLHCNFIVNQGGATSRDYLRLADSVQDKVYETAGIRLEREFVLATDE